MKNFLSLLLVAFTSLVFASDADIIKNGNWFAVTKGENFVVFYDPYKTRLNSDGFVESFVYSRHVLDGSAMKAYYIQVNCTEKTLQTQVIEANGSRQLSKDWHVPSSKSIGEEWVKTLCGIRTESGIKISFIGYMENPYNPARAAHIYWLPEVEHSPFVPGGKTYQLIYYVESDQQGYDGFIYLDCKNNRYATATFLDLDLLSWDDDPPPTSVAGYLMYKACNQ